MFTVPKLYLGFRSGSDRYLEIVFRFAHVGLEDLMLNRGNCTCSLNDLIQKRATEIKNTAQIQQHWFGFRLGLVRFGQKNATWSVIQFTVLDSTKSLTFVLCGNDGSLIFVIIHSLTQKWLKHCISSMFSGAAVAVHEHHDSQESRFCVGRPAARPVTPCPDLFNAPTAFLDTWVCFHTSCHWLITWSVFARGKGFLSIFQSSALMVSSTYNKQCNTLTWTLWLHPELSICSHSGLCFDHRHCCSASVGWIH